MIRRPPRSTLDRSSAASDVYKRQILYDALSIGTKNYLDLASEIMRNAELAIEKSTLEENVVSIENLPESVTSLLIDKKENS